MPYISNKDDRRLRLRNGETALTAGELNYQLFYYVKHTPKYMIEKEWIEDYIKSFLGEKPNYQRYNDMTGALIRCYKEIKRRLKRNIKILLNVMESYDDEIAKYEDLKCSENGDVE